MSHLYILLLFILASSILYYLRKNILFGLLSSLSFVVLGSMITNIRWIKTDHKWIGNDTVYVGLINGDVVDKGRYLQFVADVDGGRVLIRVMKDSALCHLKDCDDVAFYGKIKRPSNMGNPEEMDYASYLLHNNINGTLFLNSKKIKVIGRNDEKSFRDKALEIRHRVIYKFRTWGIDGDELALLSALIVGERNLFSQEIETDYAKSGLSHMLSISGMHVGILLLIINASLWFMRRNVMLRIIKWIILFFVLWAFAYISGLAASAVRAVIMCLLLELMYFSHEKRNPLNIIFLTALCMLVYNPFYLFDIGFQLSFAAVITIIIFYTPIKNMLQCRYSFVNKLSSVVALSTSAQIGAAPLVLYYFSNFSSYFLISNILSSFLVLVITVIALIAFILPLDIIYSSLHLLLRLQNEISSTVASLPMSVLRIDNFSIVNIIFIYAISVAVLMLVTNKRRKIAISAYVLFLLFISFNSISCIPTDIRPHAIIYSDTRMPYIHFVESRDKSVVVSPVRDTLHLNPRPAVRQYCTKNNIMMPMCTDKSKDRNIYSSDGIITWHGKRFCIVCDKRWNRKKSDGGLLDVDYLYLCRGYYGSLSYLRRIFKIRNVVIGCSVNDVLAEVVIKECIENEIPFVDLKQVGYYKIMP